MAIALIASANFAGGASGGTSGAANASGANLGVVIAGYYAGIISNLTVSDSNGNTWTRRQQVLTTTPFGLDIWDCQGTFSNGMTVTVSGAFVSFGVAYYSGAASSAFGSTSGFGSSSSVTSIQAGSLTAPGNGYLYVSGLLITDNQVTPLPVVNSGFTVQQEQNWVSGTTEGFGLADIVQTTAAALNPTWSGINGSQQSAAVLAYWSPAAGAGITGTAAWTEAKDTWSGTGAVAISGSAAWTEAKDLWSGAGGIVGTGTAAWTEAKDIWAGSGLVSTGPTGSVAWTEAKDIWAGTGGVLVSGSAAWTESKDIWSGTGSITLPGVSGSASWTESPDIWNGAGSLFGWTPVPPVTTIWTPATIGTSPWTKIS